MKDLILSKSDRMILASTFTLILWHTTFHWETDKNNKNSSSDSYLIAVHHEVVCSYKSFKDHHPALICCPLKQCVGQVRYIHVQLIGAVH